MDLSPNISDVFVLARINDCHITEIFFRILAAIPYVENLGARIVTNKVRSQVQLDAFDQLESLTVIYSAHAVVAAGNKAFLELGGIPNALGFLQSGETADPLPRT